MLHLKIDDPNHIYIAMHMYNLIEYSDNYSETSGSLWKFKRNEVPANDINLRIDISQSFKYKTAPLGKTSDYDNTNRFLKSIKVVDLLKYLSNF